MSAPNMDRKFYPKTPQKEARTKPQRLKSVDWRRQLYCCRKSGATVRACASMFRCSIAQANRAIAEYSKAEGGNP